MATRASYKGHTPNIYKELQIDAQKSRQLNTKGQNVLIKMDVQIYKSISLWKGTQLCLSSRKYKLKPQRDAHPMRPRIVSIKETEEAKSPGGCGGISWDSSHRTLRVSHRTTVSESGLTLYESRTYK